MDCPSQSLLRQFASGLLETTEEERIEKHLEECPSCLQQLSELERNGNDPLVQNIRDANAHDVIGSETSDDPSGEHSLSLPDMIGNYKILGLLGRGGMGTVYRGLNLHLNREVAIKVVKSSRNFRESALERFRREILAIGKLRHPNIVQALDAGVFENQPYLILELLEGSDFSRYVKENGPLSVSEACDAIRQTTLGLQHAHEAGLIHRDIKPSNLWRMPDGTVKILDLGLAKLLEDDTSITDLSKTAPQIQSDTIEGQVLGSPDYMSPEQAVDPKSVDFRTDLYSLGCTFFFLLAGKSPFEEARELPAKIDAHANTDFSPLKLLRKDVPPAIENLIRKMTSKRKEDRPRASTEVAEVLEQFLHSSWRKYFIALFSGLFVILGTAIYTCWNPDRETVQYYGDYIDSFGIPQGLFPLSKNEIAQRSSHYRFVSSKNKLRQVIHSNSAGMPVSHEANEFQHRPIIISLTYDDKDGRLLHADYLDQNNRPKLRLSYSGENFSVIDFEGTAKDGTLAHAWLSTTMTSTDNGLLDFGTGVNEAQKSDIQRWKLQRTAQGFIRRIEFKRLKSNTPAKDAEGIFGFEYEFDNLGRVVRLWYLDYDNKRRAAKNGVAGRKYEYDGSNLKRTVFTDIEGNPVMNDSAWAILEKHFDRNGNVVSGRYSGLGERPVFSKEQISQYQHEYDERGNLIGGAFFDTVGKPCFHVLGCSSFKSKFNPSGNTIEVAYFGTDEKPCLNKEGFSVVKILYDEQGNPAERSYFGVDGKPCQHSLGHARITMLYDKQGNLIEQTHFGLDGSQCLNEGVASFKAKFDDYGNITDIAYFGTDGKPCLHNAGFASFTANHDERGNITGQHFFDVNGKPCLCIAGYSSFHAKYNESGSVTEQSYFGTDGKPCLNNDGCASFRTKYDEKGNIVEQISFGIDGKMCSRKDGISCVKSKYDERGNRTEEAYFGVDNLPCTRNDGCSIVRSKYDHSGRLLEESYFGLDAQPLLVDQFRASIRWEYDLTGNATKEAYFGTNGEPVVCEDGYSGWKATHDERGNLVEIAFFGTDGTPCTNNIGIASSTMEYDERDQMVSMAYRDRQGNRLDSYLCAVDIVPGGQAAQLGIEKGDVFLEYDGIAVKSLEDFGAIRSRESSDGTGKELHILRDGKMLVFLLKPGMIGVGFGMKTMSLHETETER